jgi:hypothetical protein
VCNSSGGGNVATSIFAGAGFALTYAQRQPGFVCRINGAPASDPCVNTPPADAYWGLYWAPPGATSWTYASVGAGSLEVPDGGYVAFAWQTGSSNPPNVTPQPHASAPTPTPTTAPTSGGGGNGGHGNGGGHGSATPTAKPSTKPPATPTSAPTPLEAPSGSPASSSATFSTSVAATPTQPPTEPPSASDSALPTASDPTDEATTSSASASATSVDPDASDAGTEGALPAWVVPLVLLVLAAGGAAAYFVRRRNRTSP